VTAARLFWSCSAAIFDLDGTLVDTLDGLHESLNAALREHGLSSVSRAQVRRSMHGGFEASVRAALHDEPGTDARRAAVLDSYRAHYLASMLQRSEVYPTVRDVLDGQRARGCRLAVCTNRDEPVALALLEGLGLRAFFEVVVGLRPGIEPKPHPRTLQLALQRLAAGPDEALMVGDSSVDAACAASAGVPCLLYTGGYGAGSVAAGTVSGRFSSYASMLRARRRIEGEPSAHRAPTESPLRSAPRSDRRTVQ
jgi:phosphoglycolate phosphatase